MGDIRRDPLSTLRPGGFREDLTAQAYDRPPLSMPWSNTLQDADRTLLGNFFTTPVHPELPAGTDYRSPEYGNYRKSMAKLQAMDRGVSTGVLKEPVMYDWQIGDNERNAREAFDDLEHIDRLRGIAGGGEAGQMAIRSQAAKDAEMWRRKIDEARMKK